MTRWTTRIQNDPDGGDYVVYKRQIGRCNAVVIDEDWYAPANAKFSWSVMCGHHKDPTTKSKRGTATSLATAKAGAIETIKKFERRPVHNAADIEKIAKDADKHARTATRDGDTAAAKHWRAEAKAIRAQKFEGRRRRSR